MVHNIDLNRPLNKLELDDLESFLSSDSCPPGTMDISTLDGFLTALVIGPEAITPSEWLPLVWAESAQAEMQWQSERQAEHYTGLLMRQMNGIAASFAQAAEDFVPLVYRRQGDGEAVTLIDDWCSGFMQGVELRIVLWEPLLSADEGLLLLMIPLLYGTEKGCRALETDRDLTAQHATHVEKLPACLAAIYQYWLARRSKPEPVVSNKVGRNQACPCGSGKKYKKCCGGGSSLH